MWCILIISAFLILCFWACARHEQKDRLGHFWEYRNPANRTCKKCGLHQCQYRWNGTGVSSWWENHNSLQDVHVLCECVDLAVNQQKEQG